MRTGIIACLIAIPVSAAIGWLVGGAFRDPWNTLPIARFADDDLLITAAAKADKPQVVVVSVGTARRVFESRPEMHFTVEAILVNPTKAPISYRGYGISESSARSVPGQISPVYRHSRMRNGVWDEKLEAGWCGNGMATMVVRSGEAGRFTANINADSVPTRIGVRRISLDEHGQEVSEIIWSQPFPGEGE